MFGKSPSRGSVRARRTRPALAQQQYRALLQQIDQMDQSGLGFSQGHGFHNGYAESGRADPPRSIVCGWRLPVASDRRRAFERVGDGHPPRRGARARVSWRRQPGDSTTRGPVSFYVGPSRERQENCQPPTILNSWPAGSRAADGVRRVMRPPANRSGPSRPWDTVLFKEL
jgi:hypothetical protein